MWLWLAAFGLLIASMVGSALMILRPAAVSQPFLVEHALEPTQTITRAQRRKVREIYETAGRARMDAAHATALLAPPLPSPRRSAGAGDQRVGPDQPALEPAPGGELDEHRV